MSDILDYFEDGWDAVLGIPDEWKEEVYALHEFIKSSLLPGYKIRQVKIKYNTLRFYASFDREGEWNDTNGSLEDNILRVEGAIRYVEWKLK